jgi:hypothetical protein
LLLLVPLAENYILLEAPPLEVTLDVVLLIIFDLVAGALILPLDAPAIDGYCCYYVGNYLLAYY